MSFYKLLGVTTDCSMEILRENYRRLLLEYHPDKNNSIGKQSFEDIQQAYRILSNVELRLKYDQEQERHHLHTLPHTNIHLDDHDDEYICRCGTIFEIDKQMLLTILECPNCSTKIEVKK